MISGAALLVALFYQGPPGAAVVTSEAAAAKVRLEVRAPAGCTSRVDLMARIKARSSRIEVADDAALSAQVAITSQRLGTVVADLIFATADAGQPLRRVVARSCAEAADALALIIAVTLDPSLNRRPAAGPAPGPEVITDGVAGSPARAGTAAPASPPTPPAPPVTVKPVAPPVTGPPATAGTRRQVGVYLAGQILVGPAPAVMPGIALHVMVALERDGPWAPALLIGATHVWRAELSEPGGKASFTLDAASLDACPLRVRWSLFAARPCASALVGWMTARGSDTDNAVRSTRPFAAAGAAVAITAGLGSTVELSARMGVGLTLIRDSYELGATVFHRAAPLTISASLGIGTRWP